MIDALKAVKDFGIDKTMTVAGLLLFITDVPSMGLEEGGRLVFTTSRGLEFERRKPRVPTSFLHGSDVCWDRRDGVGPSWHRVDRRAVPAR